VAANLVPAQSGNVVPQSIHTFSPIAEPHLGYRTLGRRPIETVMSFVSQEG